MPSDSKIFLIKIRCIWVFIRILQSYLTKISYILLLMMKEINQKLNMNQYKNQSQMLNLKQRKRIKRLLFLEKHQQMHLLNQKCKLRKRLKKTLYLINKRKKKKMSEELITMKLSSKPNTVLMQLIKLKKLYLH